MTVILVHFAKVQIRPWNLSDSDFVMDGSQPLDPRKTIFVGGVPRPLRAGNMRTFVPPAMEAPTILHMNQSQKGQSQLDYLICYKQTEFQSSGTDGASQNNNIWLNN